MNSHVSLPSTDAAEATPASAPPDRPDRGAANRKRAARRRRRRLVFLAVLIAAGAGGYYAYRTYFAEPATAAVSYVTSAASIGAIEDAVSAVGTLAASDSRLIEAPVGGRIATLTVVVGAVVEAGDTIATLESATFEADLRVAEAQLSNLEAQLADRAAQLDLDQQTVTRQEGLFAANAVAEAAVQSARVAVVSATAQLESVRSQLVQQEQTVATARENLAATTVTAPMSGTVVNLPVQVGQSVAAGVELMTLADLSRMTVTAQVSEADIGRLSGGMPAYFTTLAGSEQRWSGTLRQILPTPTIENNVVLYSLLFDVENPGGELMIGMSAEAFFVVVGADNVLRVPVAALQTVRRGQGAQQPPGAAPAGAAGAPVAATGATPPVTDAATAPANAETIAAGINPNQFQPRGAQLPDGAAPAPAGQPFGGQLPEGMTPEMIAERIAQRTAAGGGAGGASPATAPAATGVAGPTPYTVRVLHDDGTVEERAVEVGIRDRVNAEILSGLVAGERVITATARTVGGSGAAGNPNVAAPAGGFGGGAAVLRPF